MERREKSDQEEETAGVGIGGELGVEGKGSLGVQLTRTDSSDKFEPNGGLFPQVINYE